MLFWYAVKNVIARPAASALAGLGVAAGVFMWVGGSMAGAGVEKAMRASVRDDTVIILAHGARDEGISTISNAKVREVRAMVPEGRPFSVEVGAAVELPEPYGSRIGSEVGIQGVDASAHALRPGFKITQGREPDYDKYEAVIGKVLADRAGNLIGQSIDLGNGARIQIVGVFTASGSVLETAILAPRDAAAKAALRQESVACIRTSMSDAELKEIQPKLEQKTLKLTAMRETEYATGLAGGLAGGIKLGMNVFSILTLLCAALGAVITTTSALASRVREVGSLRAMGFHRSSVLFAQLTEAAVVSLIGSVIGAAGACLLAFGTISVGGLSVDYPVLIIGFKLQPSTTATAILGGTLIGGGGGLFAAIRAARLRAVDALRS